jgi:hypothetical protein
VTNLADIIDNASRSGWTQIGLGLFVIAFVIVVWRAMNLTTLAAAQRLAHLPSPDDHWLLGLERRTP